MSRSAPQFGIAFQSNKTPAEYRALAEVVDRYPFEVVSVYNDLLFQPALGPLLWMAPALHRAHRLQDRAAGVGFDWPDVNGPAEKVEEELAEVRDELGKSAAATRGAAPVLDARHYALEAELGDLLFAVVNLCRKAGVHASIALDKANAKFERRFQEIERLAKARGIDVAHAGLEALDKLWDEAKEKEKEKERGEAARPV